MNTDFEIDDSLIEQARVIGHHTTREAAITAAPEEYLQHRKQLEVLDLFGTIDFDHKKNRQLDQIASNPSRKRRK
jgi:hypothetical protein